MKALELIVMGILLGIALLCFFCLGYDSGKYVGRQEQGEWIKVVDTTFHYEFKKK